VPSGPLAGLEVVVEFEDRQHVRFGVSLDDLRCRLQLLVARLVDLLGRQQLDVVLRDDERVVD